MAITDNKIINGSGLSELSSQIKSYVNSKIVDEVYVGDTAPTDPKAKLWVDTSAEPSNNSYTKSEIDTKLTQKQDTLTPGDNITIVNGVISSTASGSAEPDAYIKDASVSGNTLTLTKKDNTNVVFTPSGGSSGGSDGLQRIFNSQIQIKDVVSQNSAYIGKIVYDRDTDNQYLVLKDQKIAEVKATKNINPTSLLSTQSTFNENKDWVLQWIKNDSYNVNVDGNPVFLKKSIGTSVYYYWMNAEDNIRHGYIKFKDSTFNELADYNVQQQYNQAGNTLINSNNWQNYITVSAGSDWQYTQDQQDSNLYNAKELVVYVENVQGNKQMGYFNFGANDSNLGNNTGNNFYFDYDASSSPFIYYDGSFLGLGNVNNLFYIYYKI